MRKLIQNLSIQSLFLDHVVTPSLVLMTFWSQLIRTIVSEEIQFWFDLSPALWWFRMEAGC